MSDDQPGETDERPDEPRTSSFEPRASSLQRPASSPEPPRIVLYLLWAAMVVALLVVLILVGVYGA